MVYVKYHSNGLKLFSPNDTSMSLSKNSISETITNDHGVSQGSVLGPLLFLIYINELHQVIKHAEIHYFADDTNLLYSGKSLKDINQKINFELENIFHWFKANKISLKT